MKHYRDNWEQREKELLERDVQMQLAHVEEDKFYKEYNETRDAQKLEEIVQEAINAAQSQQVADGEDPLTEEEKEKVAKKAKFEQLTRAFHAPELAQEYQMKLNQAERLGSAESKGDKRASSAMSSIKESEKKSHATEENLQPDYTPLIPEQWLDRNREFFNFQ